jgi:peptide/nickel transport system substrate-binding protein
MRKLVLGAALAAVVAAAAVASAFAASSGPSRHETSKAGGTYRVGWESSFGFTNAFDPTGEYLGEAFGIYSNLLVRTVVGYAHAAGGAGNKLVPDLATSVPAPTNGGKTYTFHLKSGIKFAPPVNREITSKDIAYALQRLANTKDGGQYSFYYAVIKGWAAGANGGKISGIQTPNAKTLVINLTKPTGDFLYRMSMPATGPIPAEVAKCFEGKPGQYGRNVVSSGPYMIQGSDKVNASSCSTVQPASGFDGQTSLTLVRNPNYAASTDSKAARQNLPNEFQFTVDSNADDILNKVAAGELDDEVSSIPAQVLRKYATDSSLKSSLHQNSGDRTWYLTMNVTQAPFDDVHIRKAMNWIMDKDGLRRAWGGPQIGQIANHIVPDTLFNDQLKNFAPYKTPGDHGSLAQAKAEVKQSIYDKNHDGICDASQCHKVFLLADTRQVDKGMLPVIESSAKKIGITFDVHTVNGAYPTLQTPRRNIPIGERPGWGKDYADPLTFFGPLFDGRTIIPTGNTNYSLIGITPAIAKKVGVKGDLKNVPSVNGALDKCSVLLGQTRLSCYEALDKTLTTQVVPWVPYLWSYATHITGPKVGTWVFDQFSGGTAYSHVAVK